MYPNAFDYSQKSPAEVLPSDAHAVYAAQNAYRECVKACIGILRMHGFTYLDKQEISFSGFAFSLENALHDAVCTEIKNLEEEGFDLTVRGDDHKDFFDGQYKRLKEKPNSPLPIPSKSISFPVLIGSDLLFFEDFIEAAAFMEQLNPQFYDFAEEWVEHAGDAKIFGKYFENRRIETRIVRKQVFVRHLRSICDVLEVKIHRPIFSAKL